MFNSVVSANLTAAGIQFLAAFTGCSVNFSAARGQSFTTNIPNPIVAFNTNEMMRFRAFPSWSKATFHRDWENPTDGKVPIPVKGDYIPPASGNTVSNASFPYQRSDARLRM